PNTPNTMTAVSTSPHGNVANAIPSTITVDTLIDKTTVDITDGGNADNVINAVESTHAKVTGTIDPTATLTKLEVTDANGHVVTIDAKHVTVTNGHFTATGVDVHGLADGQLTVTAIAVDPAGNISNTATDSITLDTAIPAIPTITAPAQVGNNLTPTVTLTGTPGSTVVATINGRQLAPVVIPANGHTAVVVPTGIITPNTPNTMTAVSTSPHGNVANAIPSTITVDTLIDKTTVDITDGGNADNVINAVESTHAKVTGTIDPTATLTKLEVTDANGHVVTIDAKHVTVTNGHFTAT
ncbi:hypothetical protein, partial [Vibrio splendidus]|uniref:hypothetical protein n=1 Tax=Vibrio splendidus TaxID=29497 RepID=UPI003D121A96